MSNSSSAKDPASERALVNALLQRTLLSNVGVLLPSLPHQSGLAIQENAFFYRHANPISPVDDSHHGMLVREIQARIMQQSPRLPFLSSSLDELSRSTRTVSVCSDNEKPDASSTEQQQQQQPQMTLPKPSSADDRLLLLSSLATSRLVSEGYNVDPSSNKQEDIQVSTKTLSPKVFKKSKKTPRSQTSPKVMVPVKNPSEAVQTIKRKTKREQFPEKLYRILEELENEGMDDIISFVNEGSAFEIHQPEAFEEQVIPRYFRQRGISSFKKQLHLYGFARLKTDSRGFAASLVFHHERFQRGQPQLCLLMDRVNKKVGPTKAQLLAKKQLQQSDQTAHPLPQSPAKPAATATVNATN